MCASITFQNNSFSLRVHWISLSTLSFEKVNVFWFSITFHSHEKWFSLSAEMLLRESGSLSQNFPINLLGVLSMLSAVTKEAFVQRCSVKTVFLEISQNSQENTCARVSFLIKLHASGSVAACYSSLPNRRVARNKRGGGKDEPLLISVVPGIINGGENFYTSYSNKKKSKMN